MMAKYQKTAAGQLAGIAFGAAAVVALVLALPNRGSAETAMVVPPLAMTQPADSKATSEKAIVAGGCFWGVQAVFQHLKGVMNAVSGYAGGPADKAEYETVSTGTTGHAESVQITFDPRIVSYATILQVYFSVAHNPTELNYQGPDSGTQYRSAIFPANDAQKEVAEAYIKQLGKAHVFDAPIVTRIETGRTFYPAEAYHQDYATLHPENPYIAYNDLPKIENLHRLFPDLYQAKPRLVADSGVSN
jgi:peptide-methionine (S)-S-oxide reductase